VAGNAAVDALRRARFDVRMVLGRQPVAHYVVAWWNLARVRQSQALVTRRTELVIDGFPSSGNSFAIAALKRACSEQAVALPRVAHHLHNPGQVRKALRHGIPTLLLVRQPASTVVSALTRWPALRAEQVLRHYVAYHEHLCSHQAQMVIADFDELTSDFGAVTRSVNARYGLHLPEFEHTSVSAALVYDRDEPARAARRVAAMGARAQLDDVALRAILQTATALHEQLLAHRDSARS
jgi:hypothetical protein